MKRAIVVSVIAVLAATAAAPAAIIGVDGDTGVPPVTLGSYTMTPFGPDGRAVYAEVSSVDSPVGGSVSFDAVVSHRLIGDGWGTWSHGYTGDVYYSNEAQTLTLTLSEHTGAFYFYVEPDQFSTFTVTATAQDGTFVTQDITGSSGAAYFGFYGTGGDLINTITVSMAGDDFAIGEFGIAYGEGGPAVPAPGAILLGTFGTGLVGWLRRRKAV